MSLHSNLRASALVTLFTIVPLLAVFVLNGFRQDLGLLETVAGLLGAGLAWLYGLARTQHPLWLHVEDAIVSVPGRWRNGSTHGKSSVARHRPARSYLTTPNGAADGLSTGCGSAAPRCAALAATL